MVRRTALAAALLLAGWSPTCGLALGLGSINLESGFNQPLSAEIELLSVEEEELRDLRVSLAGPEAFEQAGVERPFLLTKLRFQARTRGDGTAYIKVTSKDPIREPFLDFVVEVNWPSGRLVREYTLLLDPPVMLARSDPAVETPTVEAAPANVATSPSTPGTPSTATAYNTQQEGVYGPVAHAETLWGIASQVLPDSSVSVEQMMMALVRENPEAFERGNANGLLQGYVLRIPQRDEVVALTEEQARAEFSRHMEQWEERRQRLARASGLRPEIAQAPERPVTAQADSVPPSDQLKLVAPDASEDAETGSNETFTAQAGSSTVSAQADPMEDQLALLNEDTNLLRAENSQLQERLALLEQQVEKMQRLIQFKDETLAELQLRLAQQSDTTEAGVDSEPSPIISETAEEFLPPDAETVPGDAASDAPFPEESTVVADSMAVAEQNLPSTDTAKATPQLVTPATDEPEVAAADAGESESTAASPAVSSPPSSTQPGSAIEESPTQSGSSHQPWMSKLLDQTAFLVGISGLAVVALGVFAFLVRRRRTTEPESFDAGLPGEALGAAALAGSARPSEAKADPMLAITDEDTSFLDNLDIESTLGMHNAEEVDPIAEADVYIAYGRYNQAEELLQQAISETPGRCDLKTKLLEIYFSLKNQRRFADYAEKVYEELEENDPTSWRKVQAMGMQLCPDHVLFSETGTGGNWGSGAAGIGGGVAQEPSDFPDLARRASDENPDIDLDINDEWSLKNQTTEDHELDFDLDLSDDRLLSETLLEEADSEVLDGDKESNDQEKSGDDHLLQWDASEENNEISPEKEEQSGAVAFSELAGEGVSKSFETTEPYSQSGAQDEQNDSLEDSAMGVQDKATDPTVPEAHIADVGNEQVLEQSEGVEREANSPNLDGSVGSRIEPLAAQELSDQENIEKSAREESALDAGALHPIGEAIEGPMEGDLDKKQIEDSGESTPELLEFDQLAFATGEGTKALREGLGEGEVLGSELSQQNSDPQLELTDSISPSDFDEDESGLSELTPRAEDEQNPDDIIDFLDDLDQGFDEATPDYSELATESHSEALGEVQSKLDLARAYVEIGDAEGAKPILDEVLEEGDDSQKEQARTLADELAKASGI